MIMQLYYVYGIIALSMHLSSQKKSAIKLQLFND